ncbi:ABC transporter [Delftia sp. GW456-R20]|uniref:ABC transporter permease n=1 Tax=Delftia sp. GW456-R20 TaxID=1827145 RepID=UPI0007AE69E2|nr:ABC transporter permease [Delftia sp. GW456-R20]KZK31896.1 ABC transporter [Delftia sp. GW456-R20]
MARGFAQDFISALRAVFGDVGVLMLLVGAPVLYGFFYPWFYGQEVVQRVPVAVVQHDGSGLARQMLRFAQASPRIEVTLVTGDEAQAQQALLDGRVMGYALLPRDLKRRVVRSEEAVVPVYANGAYPLAAKQVQYGFAEAFGTVSAGVELRRLTAGGQSALQAQASRSPVNLQMQALFNPTEGYGSFVVAAVAIIILQQTLLMGGALLVGTWREQGLDRAPARTWLARLLALCTLGWLSGLYYFGWIFVWHDYPRGGNPWGALALLAVFVPAVAGVAALLGWWLANRERAMQVVLFTSIPLAFVGGFSWPAEALPQLLQALRWLSPSTAAIQASLRLNQAGAPLEAALWHLSVLLALALLGWVAVLWLGSRRVDLPEGGRK